MNNTKKRTRVCNVENNIIYVEPNYINSVEEYDVNGLNTHEFIPALEDYSIFVNLEVETRGRNVQSSKSSNNRKLILSFISNTDGTSAVNFMQGSKIPIGEKATINSLTTNYTDIYLGDLKKNGPSTETFGIQSIDISYNSYMVPEVTIEFIDVRGVALFAQKEYYETNKNIDSALNSNNREDIANTFFQCFFTFPYPKFTLLVKGFYGQPVSYELTCADFRARFDSSTGNFACTAKFVGYHFSFLNDVMINGIVAAPYSDYIGSKYWASRKFKLKGNSGNYVDIPKIGWLLSRMKSIESEANKLIQSSPLAQEKISLDDRNDKLQIVEAAYNDYARQIDSFAAKKNQDERLYYKTYTNNGVIKAALILSPTDNESRIEFRDYVEDGSDQIKGSYDSFIEKLDEYNSSFPDENLPKPEPFYNSLPKRRIFSNENDESKAKMNKVTNKDIYDENRNLYRLFSDGVENGNNENVNPLLSYRSVYYYKDNGFSSKLENYKKKNSEKTEDVEKQIEGLKDTAVSDALGFHPTVENMTRIVMAHFETFARMIFETAKTICNEDPSRTIASLKVSDPRDINDVTNREKISDIVVPPFPKVVSEVRRDNSTIREEAWVGNYAGDFREKDLVHGIINGIKEISKDVEAYESSGDTGPYGGSEGAKSAVMRYPLVPIDMVAIENPYMSEGYDPNDVSSLLSLVALRAMTIFGSVNFKDWGSNAKILGIAEAYNFLDDHKISKEMSQKLNAISGNDVLEMLKGNAGGLIKRPGDGSKPWPWSNAVAEGNDGMIASNGDLNICRIKGGGFALPYQRLSWQKIKKEAINSQDGLIAALSNDYINSCEVNQQLIKENLFSFDTNIHRFSSIAEDQLKDIDGISYYQEKFTDECKYSQSKYEIFLKNGKKVIAFIIDDASAITPSDKSCMLPTSKNAFANKSFGGGYNMNYFVDEDPGNGGDGWINKDGEEVKRKGDNGYDEYLKNLNYSEITFTEFPGVDTDLEPDRDTSIFGQLLYYKQDNVKSRALLFLASLGYVFDYKTIISTIFNDNTTMCIVPLPAIMFIGALLWSETTEGKRSIKNYTTKYYSNNNSNSSEYSTLGLLKKLRPDVQKRFIKIFETWITDKVEGDSLLRSFNEMRSGLELKLIRKGRTYDEFFRLVPEIEDHNWRGKPRSSDLSELDASYKTIMDMFKGELSDSFFENYITIDEDVKGGTKDFTRGLRLGNRDGGKGSLRAINFALSPCVFSKNSKFFKSSSSTNVNVSPSVLEAYFDGFLEKLKSEKVGSSNIGNTQISQAREPDDSNDDVKIGIYRYCKMLYDKWIAGISDEDFEEQWTLKAFFDDEKKYFYFIDAFYNVADFLPVNVGKFCDQIVSCFRSDQFSLLSFLSDMYSSNKFNFLCVQNFIDLGDKKNMETMFDTVPYTEYWDIKRHPNFIVMYPYESSNYLDIENGEYENDGFMINQPNSTSNRWPEALTSRNANADIKYNIPAFGVSYGKMYQSYFKDIDVSMDNPTVTEQSIKAQFAIACQNNTGEQTGDRSKLYTYGQDLYSIYSNNSYTCNVTMMGCAWVQPLMYFVLNNIPMFRGTYLIEKVTHHIEPGNMTTKFMGVRMSNVCTRIAREEAVRERNNQSGNGEDNGNNPSVMEKLASVDNDCPYKEYPLSVDDGSVELSSDVASNANQLMRAIMNRGYSKEQAAGIVGNMMQESGLKPKIVVCDSQGYYSGGLCMWHKQALIALINKDSYHVGDTTYAGVSCSSGKLKELENQLPSASEQVAFLLDSFENDSVFKNWKIKQSLMAENTPEGAAVVFQNKFERCSPQYCKEAERKKYARQFYNNYSEPSAPKIANNGDKHISDLANGFLHALNRTAAASSNGIELGVVPDRSNGDTIWINNPKNSSNFSTVLDMILEVYSNNVSKVNWVLPGNGENQNSVPVAYLVTVKEGNESVSITVTSENTPGTKIEKSVHISKGADNSGIHPHYCKALVKKYKSASGELKRDTNEQIDDYDALFSDKYKVNDCNKVMSDAGLTVGSDGGQENEYGYIGDWDVGKFVERLRYWQRNICEKREDGKTKPRKKSGGCGWCTGVINRALRDSGFGYKYWDKFPWGVYNKMKAQNSDFVEVRGSNSSSNKTEFQLGEVKKGDVCVMWSLPNRNLHYHTCAFDGTNWYSDFKQNNCNVYRSAASCTMEWHLFRHK